VKPGAARTIGLAGLVAGTRDGLAACLDFVIRTGRSPLIVFQYIASGVLGPAACNHGRWTALLGVLFHFLIATGWAAGFFVVYPLLARIPAVVLGLVYGVVVMVCVGLPIALLVARRWRPS
jgi:hypothetical protein